MAVPSWYKQTMRYHHHLLIPGALVGVILLTGCGENRELLYKQVEIGELEAQVDDLKGQLGAKESELAALRARPPVVVERPSDDGLRDELAAYGAEVSWRRGELVIAIENEILFTAGSHTLSDTARRTLGRVAQIINSRYSGQYVRIEGHADNQPIVRTRDKWEDNWHLSGARARSVLHYLIERGNIPSERISFAGYSSFQPRDSHATPAGRARNRRVEIIVLPREQPRR